MPTYSVAGGSAAAASASRPTGGRPRCAHHGQMNKSKTEIVTPFDWQRYNAMRAEASEAARPRKAGARREKKPLTVRERMEKILAQRWGNPYCKPGAA